MIVIKALLAKSSGSAVTEFLIFTLPFFTSFLILLTLVHEKSVAISEGDNLARQAVRAFVTSPNDQLAHERANQVIWLYKSGLSETNRSRSMSLQITCRYYPCFTPGNLVTATVKVGNNQSSSASEYVDLWR
jgi:hypothetical protein